MLDFIRVDEETLIHGTKYKIIVVDNDYPFTKTFISTFDDYDVNGNDVKYLLWGKTTFIIEQYNPYTKSIFYDHSMSMHKYILNVRIIYKLVLSKEKIQCAMETRAVNTILQNIIGDKSFVY